MSFTDPIADLLTRIRNAYLARHEAVDVSASKKKLAIIRILKAEGYIVNFRIVEDASKPTIRIFLKYISGQPMMRELKRISKPGCRIYRPSDGIDSVKNGLGIAIYSTPKGVMTGKAARDQKVGGEWLCSIW